MENVLLEIPSRSAEETEKAGATLAESLTPGDFVALYGDLGAGKTAFVRGMAAVLAPDAPVHSPTYTIVNEYPAAGGRVFRHLDLYRITGEEDLFSIGYYDFIGEGYLAAEWCERIPYALPDRYIRVTLEKTGENERKITACRVES